MSRSLFFVACVGSAALFEIMNVTLSGTLPPALVPLVAGLSAWSVGVAGVSLPIVEQRVSAGRRYACLLGSQTSLIFGLMHGVPLWRLPGGMSDIALGLILAIPSAALCVVTCSALFTRAERETWLKRRPEQVPETSRP